jgi:hypothetical protein
LSDCGGNFGKRFEKTTLIPAFSLREKGRNGLFPLLRDEGEKRFIPSPGGRR